MLVARVTPLCVTSDARPRLPQLRAEHRRENDVPLHLRARAVNRLERLMQVNELSVLPMLSIAASDHSNRLIL